MTLTVAGLVAIPALVGGGLLLLGAVGGTAAVAAAALRLCLAEAG